MTKGTSFCSSNGICVPMFKFGCTRDTVVLVQDDDSFLKLSWKGYIKNLAVK